MLDCGRELRGGLCGNRRSGPHLGALSEDLEYLAPDLSGRDWGEREPIGDSDVGSQQHDVSIVVLDLTPWRVEASSVNPEGG